MENKREDKIEFEPCPGKRKKQKHLQMLKQQKNIS